MKKKGSKMETKELIQPEEAESIPSLFEAGKGKNSLRTGNGTGVFPDWGKR
jgi:hypothetical protein